MLRLRKANVKWLRNFYLINKYGIIREEILCIIHVFIYNTFNTNNTNNMLLHIQGLPFEKVGFNLMFWRLFMTF